MLNDIRRYVDQHRMLSEGDGVIIGVSGGPDSMALLHILRTLQPDYKLGLFVAHINHMFRGQQAKEEAEFVKAVCSRWQIPAFITEIDVPGYMEETGISAQVAGRNIRYHFFRHIAAITGANKIAVGHNGDDQAETVLFRLLRGSGAEGLAGIPPVRDGIIRPLLNTSRVQIEAYCSTHDLETRLDPSNAKLMYVRNRIRHQLIPQLEKEFNPKLRANLISMADILREEELYWQTAVGKVFSEHIKITQGDNRVLDTARFQEQPVALQRRLLRAMFAEMHIQDIGYEHIEEVRRYIGQGNTGTALQLPSGYQIRKGYGQITVEKRGGKQAVVAVEPTELIIPGTTRLRTLHKSIETQVKSECSVNQDEGTIAQFDRAKLTQPLFVRTRRPGDLFYHSGIGHHKKLKEYLIDIKVPREERDRILLLTSGDTIIWVVGYMIDHRYLADNTTKETLHIVIREDNGHAK